MKMWGGRFKKELDASALKFSSSAAADFRLLEEDIEGSLAHAEMLHRVKLLNAEEFQQIRNGLQSIQSQWASGGWKPDPASYEDVHSAVESRLLELIGPAAGKLHTGRSRNDQVATDERLWLKKAYVEIISGQKHFQTALVRAAEDHTDTIMPGYTHWQRAQPISLAFHFLAYVEMLERDRNRMETASIACDECPLGAGALAGSTLPLDRFFTSQKLGFSRPTKNALDSVSDRDFIVDFLHACAAGMMHLSRLAEEITVWCTAEWNFIRLSDAWTTGSSLMPNKKNPDMAELIRGKTGRVFGHYIALMTALKSLPLSYNRDLQEDKQPMFDSFDTYTDSLDILSNMVATMDVNRKRFAAELQGDFCLATDLAESLVLKGVPFRDAHEIVGKIVQFAESHEKKFSDLNLNDLRSIYSGFDEKDLECFNIDTALQRKITFGSPNPKLVSEQIKEWKLKLQI